MTNFDFVCIGGGSAGFNAARVAHSLGKKVAIIDGAKRLGGLCILKGCMPSKTLLWSAEVLHLASKAKYFGIKAGPASADMRRMQERKKRIISEFAFYREQQLLHEQFNLFRSDAKFIDQNTLILDSGEKLHSEHFIIATGSRITVPGIKGLKETRCWTSDDILDLDHTPESILVLGGGVVACELSQFLARIGVKVVQIQRSPHILKEYSPLASGTIEDVFVDEGIELHTDTVIENVAERKFGYSVTFFSNKTGKRHTRKAARLLNALGRSPNTEGLNLEKAGVKIGSNGRICVNRWQQTSKAHIYAGGDVCGPHDIVHLAVAQGELAARHAFGVKGLKPVNSMPLLSVAFTDPQVAAIGASESSLRAQGAPFIKASYPFNDHGKSIVMDEMRGFVTVLAEPQKGRILGVEIVGPSAGELIHSFTTPISMRATAKDMLRAPWYHPTLAEIVTYPLEEIDEQISK